MPELELLEDIANEYHILKGRQEPERAWKCRVIYSLLGQAGYASLWDNTEETESSIIHFKKRIEKTLRGITAIYPTLSAEFSSDLTKVSGEIYDTMLNAGCFYHTPNHIAIAKQTVAQGTRCQFLRGHGMNEKLWISGVGGYRPKAGSDRADYPSFSDMFDFPTESLSDFWNRLIKDIRWNVVQDENRFEAIKIKPPFSPSYWQERLTDKELSLARTRLPGSHLYYLYKVDQGQVMISAEHFPDWMVGYGNYRAISNACLTARKTLLPTVFKVDGEIVALQIKYLYPPVLMDFIRLYSWPIHYQDWPQNFRRTMSRLVFEDFREQMEKYGYRFEEA